MFRKAHFISPLTDNYFKYNFIFVNMPHHTRKFTNTFMITP